MDNQSKTIMYDTLVDQVEVQKMHALIIQINPGQGSVFTDWLTNTIDIADVVADPNDFKVGDDIDYNAFWREEYNQVKAFIKNHVVAEVDSWIATNQTLEAS